GPALVLHQLLWLFAPLNAFVLALGYRLHRESLPLVVGGLGSVLLVLHMASPYFLPPHPADLTNPYRLISMALTWSGSPLILLGALLDWRARRRLSNCSAHEYWESVLTGINPALRRGRRLFGLLPTNPRCTLCHAP